MTRQEFDAADSEWLAFLYISEEMSAEQRADFEARLAHDLAAQEALARTVHLASHLVAARPRQALPPQGPVQSYRSPGIVVAAAACAVLLAAILPTSENSQIETPHQVQTPYSQRSIDELADQRIGELVNLWSTGTTTDMDSSLVDSTSMDSDTNDLLLSEDLNVPSWLLSAISVDPSIPMSEMK